MSHGPCACRPRGRQGGASLIEVLVSLVLVAFTMLGLLGLQLRTQSFQKDSIDRRNAAIIASDFLERAAANFTGFRNGLYNGLSHDVGAEAPVPPAACANALMCTDTEIRNWDWFALRRNVSTRLPGGIAFVTSPVLTGGTRASRVQVTVGWIDPSRADPSLSVGTPQRDPECPASVTDTRYSCFSVRSFP